MKSWILGVSLSALALGSGGVLASDTYPTRTVTIVDGFPAGGSTDVIARFIASKLGEEWGAPVIVENRSGAAGQIGAGYVAKAKPDGYTFFVAPNPDILTTAPLLYENLPYNVETDFMPVAMIADVPLVMTVHASNPANTVEELIELAKASPGELTYGSAGQGTVHHLSAAMFTSMAGIDMLHVPYKGTSPAVQDLMGNHVDLVFSPITAVLPHIRQGLLKALAVAGPERIADISDLPTVGETVPGYQSTLWISLIGPKGLPDDVVEKWNKGVAEVMASDEAAEAFAPQGIIPASASVEEIQERMREERERLSAVIEEANITIQ